MINSYMKRAEGHTVTGHVTTEFCMDDTDSQWHPIHNLLQRVKTKNTKKSESVAADCGTGRITGGEKRRAS